jgi:CRP/FNR family transcriptional regulator, anaerobic regulatory protein
LPLVQEDGGMLFSSVGTAGLSRRLHSVQDLSVPTGARIITAGEDADAVFTVRAGYIKLWLTAPGGTERIVRLLKRGDVLGLECMVRRQYSLSAGAIADSQLCRIPIEVSTTSSALTPTCIGNSKDAGTRNWRVLTSSSQQ